MNCFENVSMPSCVWFESGEKRNILASIFAGLLFFIGWWFIIDTASVYPGELPNAAHVCGVMATLSLIMVNSVSNAQVRGESYSGGCMGPRSAQVWLFLGFVIAFASLIAACGVPFLNAAHRKHTWPIVGLFMQNALILGGSLVYKFGRTEDLWG